MDLTKPDPRSPAGRRAQQRGEDQFKTVSDGHMTAPATNSALTVSQLNREAKQLLEHGLPNICVEGEVSNLARPASGHWYFTLKDSRAQIRCAMFKQRNRLVRPAPQEGDKIQIRGKLTLYEARGDYQLIADHMEAAGEGALRQAYEALRLKLEQEGLFDNARKTSLPIWPRNIGVITSPSGAAVRDVIDVLGRRYKAGNIIIYPSSVQGENAPRELRAALHQAIQSNSLDVIIIGRGGGSLEDLWAFNDESLVRDVAACPTPIISAVGHETDFSLCDFAADLRAPTPSAAAELASPLADDWLAWLLSTQQSLERQMQNKLQQAQQQIDQQSHRLLQQHPLRRLEPFKQRLDHLKNRLRKAPTQQLLQQAAASNALKLRLQAQTPKRLLNQLASQLRFDGQRLRQQGLQLTGKQQQRLAKLTATLQVVSPLATLQRGYAIATGKEGNTLTDASKTNVGDKIQIKLAAGELLCSVEEQH